MSTHNKPPIFNYPPNYVQYQISPQPVAVPIFQQLQNKSELLIEQEKNRLLFQQNEDLQNRIIQIQSDFNNRNVNASSINYQQQYNQIKLEIEKVSYGYLQKQRELEFLEQKVSILTTELDNINKLYQKKVEESNGKDQQLLNLQKIKIDWSQQEANYKSQIADLSQQVNNLKSLQANQPAIKSLQDKTNTLQNENNQIKNSHNARVKEIEALQQRINQLTKENQQLAFNSQNVKIDQDKYQRTLNMLNQEVTQYQKENKNLQDRLNILQAENQKYLLIQQEMISQPSQNYLEQISSLEKKYEVQIRDLEEIYQNKYKRIENEKQEVTEKLKEFQQQIARQQDKINNYDQQYQQLHIKEREVENMRQQLQYKQDGFEQSNQFQREIQDLKFENDTLKRKNDNLLEELEQKNAAQMRLQNQLDDFHQRGNIIENEKLRQHIFEVEEALRGADKENQELVYRLEKFSKENLELKMDVDMQINLKRDLDKQDQQIREMRGRLEGHNILEERFLLLCSENERLYKIIDDQEGQIKKQQIKMDKIGVEIEDQVKYRYYSEMDQKLNEQYKESQQYIERLQKTTEELNRKLRFCEEENVELARRLHNLQIDSSQTIQSNYNKALDQITRYENEIRLLQQDKQQLNYQLSQLDYLKYQRIADSQVKVEQSSYQVKEMEQRIMYLQNENERLNSIIMERCRDYRW